MKEIQKYLDKVPANTKPQKVLKLPINHIKGISKEVENILDKTLGVSTIGDFARTVLTRSKVHLLKVLDIDENSLDKWQALASYIVKLVEGTAELPMDMKILIAGLNNAGKTAICSIISKNYNVSNLKPTKEVDIHRIQSKNVSFVLWDMGGQELYRRKYISSPDRYFIGVDSVIYVIDVQNKEDYEPAKEYLIKILDILETFKEFPDFRIFFHKADPQVYNNIVNDLRDLEDQVAKIFEKRPFSFRIFHTSIYNQNLTETNLADSLGKLLDIHKEEGIPSDLTDSLQFLYNNIINLSYLIEDKFKYFEERLANVESQNKHLLNSLSLAKGVKMPEMEPEPDVLQSEASPSTLPAAVPQERIPLSPRAALNDELKRLFRHRKGG